MLFTRWRESECFWLCPPHTPRGLIFLQRFFQDCFVFMLCMKDIFFLLFTADAQFIHILKKKEEERNLSSLSLTSSSSIKSGPRLHHLLHLFHQHLKSCSQYLLFLQRLVKSMNGEVVKVARLLCFSLSSNFFSMALPLLMSFFSSSFFSLPSYSKDQLSSIPVKGFWFELGTGLSCQIFTYNCVECSRAGKFNFLLFAAHSITVIFS